MKKCYDFTFEFSAQRIHRNHQIKIGNHNFIINLMP